MYPQVKMLIKVKNSTLLELPNEPYYLINSNLKKFLYSQICSCDVGI